MPAGSRPPRVSIVIAICCAAQFMVVLDVSVVNVALPDMRRSLALSVTGQQWVVNAYTLAFAGLLMLGGRAGDLFGRRRVFLTGLLMFTVASAAAGTAVTGGWLVAARAAQGMGGAVLAPASLSLLTTSCPDPRARMRALRFWSATASSAAAVGVVAGGLITHFLGWRWIMFINVPIGCLLGWGAATLLTADRRARESQSLDVAGSVAVTAGLTVVVYGIVSTSAVGWISARTLATLGAGGVILLGFLLVEARFARDPLVPLATFRRRSVSVANGLAVGVGCGLFGMYFFLSLYLQQVNGYTALAGGLAFLPSGLTNLLTSLSLGRLPGWLSGRRQLVAGPLIAAGALLWLSRLTAHASYAGHVLGPLILFGFGLGLTFVPMTATATEAMPPRQAGLAAALVSSSRQFGGAVGLAVMATVAAAAARPGLAGASRTAALTSGYDRAFLVPAGALAAGAMLVAVMIQPWRAVAVRRLPPLGRAPASAPRPAAGQSPAHANEHGEGVDLPA